MLCIPNSFGALLLKVGAVKTLNLFNVCLTILVPKLKGTFHFSKSEAKITILKNIPMSFNGLFSYYYLTDHYVSSYCCLLQELLKVNYSKKHKNPLFEQQFLFKW